MAIKSLSQFYFGYEITTDNQYINFDEGGPELTAILRRDYFTLTDFLIEIGRAMSSVGGQTYSATVDRETRIITITAAGSFTLLAASGTNVSNSPFALMGYAAIDVTGSALSGGSASGYLYRPQFSLQDYVQPGQRKESVDSTINETGSGRVEVITFGLREFMECNIRFITNIRQSGAVIQDNPTGYEDALFFMDEITKRGNIEFMPDRDDPDNFFEVSLESTEQDAKGLKYKLTEESVSDYYRTGKLVFRII